MINRSPQINTQNAVLISRNDVNSADSQVTTTDTKELTTIHSENKVQSEKLDCISEVDPSAERHSENSVRDGGDPGFGALLLLKLKQLELGHHQSDYILATVADSSTASFASPLEESAVSSNEYGTIENRSFL